MDYHAPNPCLLAILLTISTHSGPSFVCHYPPVPDTHNFQAAQHPFRTPDAELLSESSSDDNKDTDSNSSDNEGSETPVSTIDGSESGAGGKKPSMTESLLDRLENNRGRRQVLGSPKSSMSRLDRSRSVTRKASDDAIGGHKDSKRGSSAASLSNKGVENWQKVLGFDSGFLGELLCPTRSMCNTKFELTVDDMVFLGVPVHIQQNGEWKASTKNLSTRSHGSTSRRSKAAAKRRKQPPRRSDSVDTVDDNERGAEGDDEVESGEESDELESPGAGTNDYTDSRSPMRMFHVVFVMNPPVTEYNLRIDEMYHYVLKNFVKCLKHEQHKNNYVWNEVSTLLQVRDEASMENASAEQLWAEMQHRSTLAASIGQLFDAISVSGIANVLVNSKIRSFQVPIQTEFHSLPPITAPRPKLAFLTTTGPFVDTHDESAEGLTPHYAILLLDDPEAIIRNIRVDPYSSPAAFIREITPTMAIEDLAVECGMSTEQIISITRDLMLRRQARAIIPIHHRNMYIVSPLAPLAEMYRYVSLFDEKFPSLPSLPRMLSMLSTGKPRPFSAIIPSRDHRHVYINALTWLLQNGFVSQLKTFLFLKISKRIKTSVFHDMQLEEDNMQQLDMAESVKVHKRTDRSTDNTSKQRQLNNSPAKNVVFVDDEVDTDGGENETRNSTPEPDNVAIGDTMTDAASRETKGENEDGDDDDDDDDGGDDDEFQGLRDEDMDNDTILLEPDRATLLQRKWINKMLEDKPVDVQQVFTKVIQYFNGKNTMEKAMVLERLSRQDMRRLISSLEEHIVVVRHW